MKVQYGTAYDIGRCMFLVIYSHWLSKITAFTEIAFLSLSILNLYLFLPFFPVWEINSFHLKIFLVAYIKVLKSSRISQIG